LASGLAAPCGFVSIPKRNNDPERAFSQSSDLLFGFFLQDPVLRFGSRQAPRS
jgi:hypothetical protein